jgi:hypothetical protein
MNRSITQKIKAALLILSAAMMLALGFSSPAAVSSGAAILRPSAQQHPIKHNPNHILFRRGIIDTEARGDLDTAAADSRLPGDVETQTERARIRTRVIQLAGPVRREWVERILSTGAEIVAYIPNNAYIVRGPERAIARLASMRGGALADRELFVRWMGEFRPVQKIDPVFTDDFLAVSDSPVEVDVELVDSAESREVIERINEMGGGAIPGQRRFLNYIVVSARLPANRLAEVAAFDEVMFIAQSPVARLHDERSAQIAAGNLAPDGLQPAGPGYLAWLESKGLDGPANFLIDFTDTGIDRGSTADALVHPDFRDREGRSRVAYSVNYTKDPRGDDRLGHGTLVAATATGLGSASRIDDAGYMYGLGVDPNVGIGASRIFDYSGRLPFQISFTAVASAAYEAGARISNNSWGYSSNSYDVAAQEYDALARDAQPDVPGNQEMLFVFSAGNGGAGGHVSSPGLAKNVISVAASESYRPEGVDSCNLDGLGPVGPDGADSAVDILRFSSGGPTANGRAKPDIAAPGTHIFGAASQAPEFFAAGLCPGTPIFRPIDQDHLYTWSSGTSLAAPHVAGAASLVRRVYAQQSLAGDSTPPSPAMIKALLLNSASYLTGENAGGSLPAERQGWGRVDLSRAFDGAKRKLIDQPGPLTQSGQALPLIAGSIADRSRGLRVTLAWTDAPGALAGPAIVNDLDLEVVINGATVYRGNNFSNEWSVEGGEADRVNNVESIYIPPDAFPQGPQGNFVIIVRAANIAGDGVPGNDFPLDQDFALVAYNITDPFIVDPPPPPRVPVITIATYEGKRLTIAGHGFDAAARVEINGEIIERDFEFDAAANALKIKLKYKKLNFKKEAENLIVVITNTRSAPYSLRL